MVPKRAPAGKIVRWVPGKPCTLCGTPMVEAHFSKDAFKRRYEEKWCIHYACHEKMMGVADRNTR